MRGLRSWRVCGFLLLSACGARSALDTSRLTDTSDSAIGGAPGLDGAPIAIAGRSNPAHAGMTSGGATSSSGGMATASGGMAAAAGAPAAPRLATMISAGADMSCATTSDGSAWCWGSNDHGQLGNGTETSSWVPVRVKRIDTAVAISAGGTWNAGGKGASLTAFACAVLRSGAVVCWGQAFGNADLDRSLPHTITGVNSAVAIACGNTHACALTSTGAVWCWGANGNGQLGSGVTSSGGPVPVQVQGIAAATAVAGQGSDASCAVQTDGSVWCWGKYNGGADFGSSLDATTTPVRVSGVSASESGLAVGRSRACAISRDGMLQCWGLHDFSAGPMTVQGLRTPAVAVSEGALTTCALLNDQTLQCWGEGRRGQLGNNASSSSKVPVDVSGISDAVAVSVGYVHACALSRTGSVRCWGAHDGLGSEPATAHDSPRPVTVTGF
jgi:alpha-tubulin suppressor-like RCC1 family protein